MAERSPPKPSAKARRSAARLAAVQALYQIGQTGIDPEAALGEFLQHRIGVELDGESYVAPDPLLFAEIVRGVTARRADIDPLVAGALAPPWDPARLELLLRAIVAGGAWELLGNAAVPARIVISEYVNLAHAFFAGREPAMVNAVLDRIAHRVRPEEMAAPAGM